MLVFIVNLALSHSKCNEQHGEDHGPHGETGEQPNCNTDAGYQFCAFTEVCHEWWIWEMKVGEPFGIIQHQITIEYFVSMIDHHGTGNDPDKSDTRFKPNFPLR